MTEADFDLRDEAHADMKLTNVPVTKTVTGVRKDQSDPASATDTVWRVVAPGVLKKV